MDGAVLKTLRKENNLLQREVAEALGINRTTYVKYETGVSEPDNVMLIRLASFFNVSTDYLLARTDDPTDYKDNDLIASLNDDLVRHFNGDIKKAVAAQKAIERDAKAYSDTRIQSAGPLAVPNNTSPGAIRIKVLGSIPAGIPIEAVEDVLDWEEIPANWGNGGKEYFALKVKGDSMYPEYLNGDVVIIKKQPSCESGDDCAVYINGYEATLKRVFLGENGGLTIKPLNQNYAPMTFIKEEVEQRPITIAGIVVELRRKKNH